MSAPGRPKRELHQLGGSRSGAAGKRAGTSAGARDRPNGESLSLAEKRRAAPRSCQ
jgi:hypothetical protein